MNGAKIHIYNSMLWNALSACFFLFWYWIQHFVHQFLHSLEPAFTSFCTFVDGFRIASFSEKTKETSAILISFSNKLINSNSPEYALASYDDLVRRTLELNTWMYFERLLSFVVHEFKICEQIERIYFADQNIKNDEKKLANNKSIYE